MSEPEWLTEEAILAVHEELIAEHGGLAGLRDEGLLNSALARPRNLLAYGDPTIFDMAAAYAGGIVGNHPFLDGNKRTALMAVYVFLQLNGRELTAPEIEAVVVFQDLAAGELDETVLAKWIEANAVKI